MHHAVLFKRRYIASEYGSLQAAKMEVLCDFFKHAFDGDGDDGGSCIDGRLTSAWNWCSKIEKKKYDPKARKHVLFRGF